MKRRIEAAAALMLIALCVAAAGAQPAAGRREVKVLVMGMFEVGKNEGDFAGEFQHYYEAYFDGAASYAIPGFPGTLFLNGEGVAGCVAGMGKAQAASTLTAILADPRFDFSRAYILVSGCAGMPPLRGTLGDVVWAEELVDFELGHAWAESDIAPGTKATFQRSEGYDRSGYVKLNKGLVDWAYGLTKGLALADDPKAAAYRANYGAKEAAEKPAVRRGVSVTGDSYWHGARSSAHADEVCAAYGAGPYLATQMEDNGFGVAALNFGLLDRLLICRDIVNFDQPYPGQTVPESLAASSGGFSMGMTNGFMAGSTVINAVLADWASFKAAPPAAK
ncbi:MAG TPA: purine nucleoside permease [Spirochaetales bacterium]|nr:purine nucleoside permease [Spirochaetales bacterium]HRY55982.1 purine nucleoside permease [Spirochaetia bacterium]